jgi:hypothetical protein
MPVPFFGGIFQMFFLLMIVSVVFSVIRGFFNNNQQAKKKVRHSAGGACIGIFSDQGRIISKEGDTRIVGSVNVGKCKRRVKACMRGTFGSRAT